jgi:fluoride ion exporter CrcB/FEX
MEQRLYHFHLGRNSRFERETYTASREDGLWSAGLSVVSSVMLGYVAVWLGALLARR